jgi:hypothetical protein
MGEVDSTYRARPLKGITATRREGGSGKGIAGRPRKSARPRSMGATAGSCVAVIPVVA